VEHIVKLLKIKSNWQKATLFSEDTFWNKHK